MNKNFNEGISGYANKAFCEHTSLVQEFAYGAPTGNYICIQCECLLPSAILGKKSVTIQQLTFKNTSSDAVFLLKNVS